MTAALLLVVALVALPGCGYQGLSFVADDRVSIVAPKDRASVELPMTVRWKVTDFDITGPTPTAVRDAGYFAVFVDRAPQAPGRTVDSLAKGDAQCAQDPACPNGAYFASRGVYTTDQTEVTVDFIPDFTQGQARDFHELTVVLLDGRGARIGESAFRVEFEVGRG